MQKSIKKYYIGLGVVALLVIGLLSYVLMQANTYKKDTKLNSRASEIAEDLNNYITEKQELPEGLSEAVSGDVPEAIKYTKESEKRYKFCITYGSTSSGVSSPQQVLFEGLYGGFGANQYNYESDYAVSSLYVNTYSWEKGEQCQDIEPYLNTSYDKYDEINYGDSSSFNYVCETDYEYYDLYKDYCVDGKYQYSN